MTQSTWAISIPLELLQYTNYDSIDSDDIVYDGYIPDFGVKLVKDEQGNMQFAAYYSDIGELIKKIYYTGSSVSAIEHYRNNQIYSYEQYYEGSLTKKTKYSRSGEPVCTVSYKYNKKRQIITIQKSTNGTTYEIEYGYDELQRVNSRTIKVNNIVYTKQIYLYDILDRVVNYYDRTQSIKVNKINQHNELIHYTITDRIGNTIEVVNRFLGTEYLATEIKLNGHKTTVNDKSYLDNIMLKKPFTSEDDLDFTISNVFRNNKSSTNQAGTTRRKSNTDTTNYIINNNVNEIQKPVPISMRKQQLLMPDAS